MVVNYSPVPVPVTLRMDDGSPAFRTAETLLLHAGNARAAMENAPDFSWEKGTATDGQLTLPPYAVARASWQ